MNINDQNVLKELRRAFISKEGQTVFQFIRQELNDEFDYDKIDCSDEDRIVGERFKVAYQIKKVLKKIENIAFEKPREENIPDF